MSDDGVNLINAFFITGCGLKEGGEENVRSVGYCDAENKAETGCWYCDNLKRERFVRCDGFSSGQLYIYESTMERYAPEMR